MKYYETCWRIFNITKINHLIIKYNFFILTNNIQIIRNKTDLQFKCLRNTNICSKLNYLFFESINRLRTNRQSNPQSFNGKLSQTTRSTTAQIYAIHLFDLPRKHPLHTHTSSDIIITRAQVLIVIESTAKWGPSFSPARKLPNPDWSGNCLAHNRSNPGEKSSPSTRALQRPPLGLGSERPRPLWAISAENYAN